MREINPELQERLNGGATTLCRCWLVQRRDGVVFGFTDHDRDLAFEGNVFLAGTGMDASALEASTGLSVDNAQAVGALSADGVSEEDIRAGRYDRAEVWHWLVDWSKPDLRMLLFRGFLGEIRRSGGAFEVEMRSRSELLNQPLGRSFLPQCDRQLGDAKCGVDLDDPVFAVQSTVVEVSDRRFLNLGNLDAFSEGWFSGGSVHWLDGPRAGLATAIKRDVGAGSRRRLELWEEVPENDLAEAQIRLVCGCDKAAATCREKFANFLNFRGFPHIPGDDWVTAFPAKGELNDGGSLVRGAIDGLL